jgi:hypothetical protein
MQDARGSRIKWESAFGSRSGMFGVLGLITFEFLMIVSGIFLGDFVLGWFVRFILLGLAFLVHVVAVFVFVVRGFFGFHLKRWLVFIPVLFLIVTGFPLLLLNQKAVSIRFLIFRGLFTDFAQRVINQEFPVQPGSIFEEVSVPFKFFFIGKGQIFRIGRTEIENNSMVFFQQFGFFDQECGYIYSTKNQIPFQLGGGNEATYSLVFQRVSKNWFYGCMNYEG